MISNFLSILAFATCALALEPTESYRFSTSFDSGNVLLYWKADDTHITFEVHGKTEGWVGIGLSPNGAMTGADMFVGWVKGGIVTVTDRHGTGNTFPPIDPQQNIDVETGMECDGWTMFKFTRQLASCESNDREITDGTQRIIWAYGSSDPTGDDIVSGNYHSTNRGTQSMYLLVTSNTPSDELPVGPDYKTFEIITENFNVPAVDTYYNCKVFKLPELNAKHHVVKFDPIIQAENIAHVHHLVISTCITNQVNASQINMDRKCSDGFLRTFPGCMSILTAWAVGGGSIVLPENVGYSIDENSVYIMLETHYDNPTMRSDIVDSSGMKITYTDTLRQDDMGIVEVGNIVSGTLHFIPPGAESYLNIAYCAGSCLESKMDAAGVTKITIFTTFLHTHLAGRSVKLRHFRNGEELPYIAFDPSYDFDYQENKFVDPYIEVLPGDVLRVECVYNTKDHTEMLQGGEGTQQEMCMAFLGYYPKIDFDYCLSAASNYESWPYFGIYNTSGNGQGLQDFTVTEPAELSGKTVLEVMSEYNWTEENIDKFSEDYIAMTQFQYCIGGDVMDFKFEHYKIPDITSEYTPEEKVCVAPTNPLTQALDAEKCGTGQHFPTASLLLITLFAIYYTRQY